jgi:hypothetical protein
MVRLVAAKATTTTLREEIACSPLYTVDTSDYPIIVSPAACGISRLRDPAFCLKGHLRLILCCGVGPIP